MPLMGIPENLKALRASQGLSQPELARRANVSQQLISQLEGGKNLTTKYLSQIARALGVSVGEIDENFVNATRTVGQRVASIIPGRDLTVLDKLMPVFSGAQGGTGKLIVSTEPIDRVKMPAFLENVSGAYGLLIDGGSMIPAFYPGDTALVNPHLRPQRGRNVILYHTPPNGQEAEAIIKQLNGWNDREWDLEQWSPALQFKEQRAEWPICHRVVGKYDAI